MTLDDADLGRLLASVGRHLEIDSARTTTAEHGRRPRHRLLLAAAAAVLVILLAVVIAPVRRTIADWLGLGSTSIVRIPATVPTTAPLPAIDAGLRIIDADGAAARLGHPLPDGGATELGPAQRIAEMPEGGVLLVWADGATTLWVHDANLPAGQLLKKLISAGQEAQRIDDLGDDALAVTGEHILVTPRRTIHARTVVLWTEGGLEWRLESDLPLETMVRIARQL